MKKLTDAGPYFYAIAVAAFGVIQLVVQNFLPHFFPVPAGLPWRAFWVDLSSILFLLAGIGVALRVRPYVAAALAGYIFFLFFFSVHLPKMLTDIYNPNTWSPAFEALMLGCGAFIIADNIGTSDRRWSRVTGIAAVAGIYLFELSLVIIFLLWVLTLNGPRAAEKRTVETAWASLFEVLAVCGVAFSIYQRATRTEFRKTEEQALTGNLRGASAGTGCGKYPRSTGVGALGKGVLRR